MAGDGNNINDTFGAMLIGAFITMGIYGITTLQMYFYYMAFPKDSIGVKTLVGAVWIIDTLHVIFMCHTMHHYLISGFEDHTLLGEGTWTLFASVAMNILMAFVSQCFFTQRIHRLSPEKAKWWISSIIGFVVFAHFCFGMETVVLFFIRKEFARLQEDKFIAALPFAVTAILSDVFIALALCLLLDSNRSEFQDTNNVINKLIVYAVNRCILTSVIAIVEVIIFIRLPKSFYSFAIDFIIGKLYANSLLASLNSRQSLRQQHIVDSDTSTSFNLASVGGNGRNSLVHVPSRDLVLSRRIRSTDDHDDGSRFTGSTGLKSDVSFKG